MEYNGPRNPRMPPAEGEAGISIYLYRPWMGGAIAGVVTFGVAMAVFLWYMRRRGTRWIYGLLALGCLMEVGGYAARIKGHENMFLVSVFVAQYFLIVVAPIPFAAAIYLVLSYVAQRFPHGRRLLWMPPRAVVTAFVCMDIITIAIQVTGAALVGVVQTKQTKGETPPVTTETANNILLAGLAVQTAFFTLFLTLLITAIMRVGRISSQYNLRRNALWIMLVDLAAALLVLLRTVYRLAVECQGYFGSANSSQTLYTCLEFLPVILAMAVFAAFPLYRYLPTMEQKRSLETDTDPAELNGFVGGEEIKDTYSAQLESRRSRDYAGGHSRGPSHGQQQFDHGAGYGHGQQYEQFDDFQHQGQSPQFAQHAPHAQQYQETQFGGPQQYANQGYPQQQQQYR